jgi:hypothetical protein
MTKIKFSPLKMDSKTIAKLDSEQLDKIKGGSSDLSVPGDTTSCTSNSCKRGTSCNGASLEQSADL